MLTVSEQTKPAKITTIEQALAVVADCKVVDYLYFEGSHPYRERQKELFLNDEINVPKFDYPNLQNLDVLRVSMSHIQQALKVLTENIDVIGWDRAEPYLASLIFRLKCAQLVEASGAINGSLLESGAHAKAAYDFMELNSQLYGDMNERAYFGIMRTEYERALNFEPKNELASEIKEDVLWVLEFARHHANEERVVPTELIATYRPKVLAMYKNILQVVPEGQTFNAKQCVELMNAALKEGGLAEYGWKAVIDAEKTSPATHGSHKRIYIPSDTERTSEQLQGLILHEQEVHARRYQNGSHFTQFPPLSLGTAEYLPVEEGLGTIMAMLAAPKETSPIERARTRYIHVGLALGIGSEPKDARQVFEITWRIRALQNSENGEISDEDIRTAREETYTHIENIFRGTDCTVPGVAYIKAKVYYEGLLKSAKHLMAIKGDNAAFVRIFLGKYNHTDATETAHIMRIIKPA